ncbi:hypothetical protein VCHA34P112_190039 [Vibrio chagasii]|nr:hypothetical protein VCHA34P112_190039 [Vibrio chagasii]
MQCTKGSKNEGDKKQNAEHKSGVYGVSNMAFN